MKPARRLSSEGERWKPARPTNLATKTSASPEPEQSPPAGRRLPPAAKAADLGADGHRARSGNCRLRGVKGRHIGRGRFHFAERVERRGPVGKHDCHQKCKYRKNGDRQRSHGSQTQLGFYRPHLPLASRKVCTIRSYIFMTVRRKAHVRPAPSRASSRFSGYGQSWRRRCRGPHVLRYRADASFARLLSFPSG